MGSPSHCYQEIMREYIRINSRWNKYEQEFTDEYLQTLSESELEELVKNFNQNHKEYGYFMAGVATAHFMEEASNDEINACGAALGDLYYLFNIEEPDEVDFISKARWIEIPRQIRTEGIWEEPEYSTIHYIICSRCNKSSPGQGKYDYCPHCGSEMKNADNKTKLPRV